MLLESITFETDGARARKHVSGSEPFALGHYAGNPIYPGVQTLQLMLDVAEGLLHHDGLGQPTHTRVSRTQYLDMVRAGDVLDVSAEITRRNEGQVRVVARISANGVLKTRGTFDYTF